MKTLSLTESVYEAEKIVNLRQCELGHIRVGESHRHRVAPQLSDMRLYIEYDDLLASTAEICHTGILSAFTVIESDLLDLYLADNRYGGRSDPDWAWRPGLYWYYCEPCKTLFWIHGSRGERALFPVTYYPTPDRMIQIENAGHAGTLSLWRE